MKNRKQLFTLTLLFLAFSLLNSPHTEKVAAWGGNSHQYIAIKAASYLENVAGELGENGIRWAQLFRIYESELKMGSIAPDRVFRDSINHIYHVKAPELYPNAPKKAHEWYNTFKIRLQEGNYSGAVWSAGVMSHYIADLCQPQHTDETKMEDDGSKNGGVSGHQKYEMDGNAKIDTLAFDNHTPILLEKDIEETVIDCAIYSHEYNDDLCETYWNGSFWTPWVEETTTNLVNHAAKTISNILYTAITEVNVSLPDFTPLAINLEVSVPFQIYQGTTYKGTINTTNWNGTPLDTTVRVTRTWTENYSEDNATNGEVYEPAGPFIVLTTHEGTGIYTFEINIAVTGVIFLDVTVEKVSMISKNEIIEINVLQANMTSTTSNGSSTLGKTSPAFSPFILVLGLISLILVIKKEKK
ncbi:MAG: zinc dependent phospholipase C family protein [Candidatus Odinarchaeota archaeon]